MEKTKEELLALRDPLCRAEIAASLLERETLGSARRLAETIRAAISEVDDRIEVLARELFAPRTSRQRSHSVAALFNNLLQRVMPPLAARGVGIRNAESDLATRTDAPELLRRCLIALLRFGAEQPTNSGFAVGWVLRPEQDAQLEQLGVRIAFDPSGVFSENSFTDLQRFADRERVELSASPAENATEIVAWLPTASMAAR